jgi:starch-binding outer membrane protein, SusD/RagB family
MNLLNKIYYSFLFVAVLGLAGCTDFLSNTSDTQKMTSNSFKTYDDLRNSTAYLYCQPWMTFNTAAGTVIEGRANNILADGYTATNALFGSFMENGSITELLNVWQSLYNVVTESDYVINNYAPITRQYVDTVKVNGCEGEARFMRGTAYWYLTMLWHDVPIVDVPEKYTSNYQINSVEFEDVLQYAINDLKYAVKYLPTTDDAGRVTKYSAEGMLARLYLTAADYALGGNFSDNHLQRNKIAGNTPSNDVLAQWYFDEVKALTLDVITNGTQYKLMTDYEELFRVQNNNNSESLFSLQFIPGSSILGNSNGSLAYIANLTGNLPAYGGSRFASYDMVHLSALDKGKSRERANFFFSGEKYSYLNYLVSTPYNNLKCNIKKQVVGSAADTDGKAISGNSGLMTPMLRLADVYLMYTEASMGKESTTTDVAYFQQVRKRAFYYYDKNGLKNPYYASTVVHRDSIFKERRLEFFMEYQTWPDIVRRSFYDMDWVKKYLNNTLYRSDAYKNGNPFPKATGGAYYIDPAIYSINDQATQLTNFSWFTYSYNPSDLNNSGRAGFTSTGSGGSPRLDGSFYYWGNAYHEIQIPYPNDGSTYVHSSLKDNIWSLPYPDVEATYNPKLIEKPIKYNF